MLTRRQFVKGGAVGGAALLVPWEAASSAWAGIPGSQHGADDPARARTTRSATGRWRSRSRSPAPRQVVLPWSLTTLTSRARVSTRRSDDQWLDQRTGANW